jgi:hypothetical protein
MADIVIPSTATAGEVMAIVTNNALQLVATYTDQVDTAADRVLDLSGVNTVGGGINSGYYIPVTSLTAIEPDVPSVDDSRLTYDAQLSHLVGLLSGQLASYFNTYYPLASDAFDESTNWLINTITSGGTGIPQAIEDQFWQRERDRHLKDGQRMESSITSGYSARGFKIAQPAMVYNLNQAKYEQHGKIGVAGTTIAVKQAEISIETIKFAITNAIDSRFKAMNAAANYIQSLMTAPDAAARVAGINTDAKAKMMAATSDMYRARLSRDELVIRSQTDRMQTDSQFQSNILSAKQGKINGEVQAAAAAIEGYARVASTALSTMNSVAGTSSSSFA